MYAKVNRIWATILPRTFPTTWAQYVHQKIVALNTVVISPGAVPRHLSRESRAEGRHLSLLLVASNCFLFHPRLLHPIHLILLVLAAAAPPTLQPTSPFERYNTLR